MSDFRYFFDEMVGVDSADLTVEEIDLYMPEVNVVRAHQGEQNKFIKTHSALTTNTSGRYVIPISSIKKVIYVIRNPLDVCISLFHYFNLPNIQSAIDQMNNDEFLLSSPAHGQHQQIHQYIRSWTNHVKSWAGLDREKIRVVRYEDMLRTPLKTFTHIARFSDLDASTQSISNAIEQCSFKNLQKEEAVYGFEEKLNATRDFFRNGEIGSYRAYLTNSQIKSIVDCHRDVMLKFGYIDLEGNLIF